MLRKRSLLFSICLVFLLVTPAFDPAQIWEAILAFFAVVWTYDGVKFLIYHVLLNTAVALAVSIYTGEFVLEKLFRFLYRKLLPYVVLYYVAKLVGMEVGQEWIAAACWAIIELTLLGDLADNVLKIGLPLPAQLEMALVWLVGKAKAKPSVQTENLYYKHFKHTR